MRIGLIGGTFDPIHTGHLIIAEEAVNALELDQVVFAPAGQPPHKPADGISDPEHRSKMVQLAIADNEQFTVSRVDLDRAGPCYTVDTIRLVQSAWGPSTEVCFLIGGDSLRDLPTWHQPERLLHMCQLVAVPRPGYQPDLEALDVLLPGASQQITILDAPTLDISSTEIRARIREGRSIRYLVPRSVERYIGQHGLYRDPPGQ